MIKSQHIFFNRFNWSLKLVILAAMIILAVGCSSTPQVINHPAPQFSLNTTAFDQSGCSEDQNGRQVCPADSPVGRLGCEQISTPGMYLGGLEPAYPLNVCWIAQTTGDSQYVYREGCLLPQYLSYVIWENGSFRRLADQTDLRAAYAPILSKNEALSYALAATGLAAYFDLQAPSNLRYFSERLEDTHVEVSPEGYLVHLYHYQLCGCGPHTTTAVEILVRQDGRLEELSRSPVYEDPEQDGLCID